MRWISYQSYQALLQQFHDSVEEANNFRLLSWELLLRVEQLEAILTRYDIPLPQQDGSAMYPFIID